MTTYLNDKGTYTLTELPEYVEIGNYSSVGEGVYFHPANDDHLCIKNRKCVYTTNWLQYTKEGKTVIGSDVWIGREAKILFGVTIGHGAIIGAYTVVTKDVPPFAVVVGNPGRITRYRFEPHQREKLLEIKWWNNKGMAGEAETLSMQNIDVFLDKYKHE